MKTRIILLLLLVGLVGCGGTKNAENETKDFCFKSVEEFDAFFPSEAGGWKLDTSFSNNQIGIGDSINPSSCRHYLYGSQDTILICLTDYCKKPEYLSEMMSTSFRSQSQALYDNDLEKINEAVIYDGYSLSVANGKLVTVRVAVDARFEIYISGEDIGTKALAMKLLKGLPLRQLAKKGK